MRWQCPCKGSCGWSWLGCTSPQGDLMLLVSASCRTPVPPHCGVQVTLHTWHWHSIMACELLVSCRTPGQLQASSWPL